MEDSVIRKENLINLRNTLRKMTGLNLKKSGEWKGNEKNLLKYIMKGCKDIYQKKEEEKLDIMIGLVDVKYKKKEVLFEKKMEERKKTKFVGRVQDKEKRTGEDTKRRA